MKRLAVVIALVIVLLLLPNPSKPAMKRCGCGAWNEADRTHCISCGCAF